MRLLCSRGWSPAKNRAEQPMDTRTFLLEWPRPLFRPVHAHYSFYWCPGHRQSRITTNHQPPTSNRCPLPTPHSSLQLPTSILHPLPRPPLHHYLPPRALRPWAALIPTPAIVVPCPSLPAPSHLGVDSRSSAGYRGLKPSTSTAIICKLCAILLAQASRDSLPPDRDLD